jgi:hypothetical protein
MSEESRLGREAIETAYALKQLVTAGVHFDDAYQVISRSTPSLPSRLERSTGRCV